MDTVKFQAYNMLEILQNLDRNDVPIQLAALPMGMLADIQEITDAWELRSDPLVQAIKEECERRWAQSPLHRDTQ